MRYTQFFCKNLSSIDKIEFIRSQIIHKPAEGDDFPMAELPIPPTMPFSTIVILISICGVLCISGYYYFTVYQLKKHLASLEEIHQTTLETHKDLENLSEKLNMPIPTPLPASDLHSFFIDVYNYFFGS